MFVWFTCFMCEAEMRLFNSFKIIQQFSTASLFNFWNHCKQQTGKVSMFYCNNLGKGFFEQFLDILLGFSSFSLFCISLSCYMHAKFQVPGFKIKKVYVIAVSIFPVYIYRNLYLNVFFFFA